MAEGGHDPRSPDINPSSEPTIAKGRTISRTVMEKLRIFEDKQHMIHSGRRGRRSEPSDCAAMHETEEKKESRSVMEKKRLFEGDHDINASNGRGITRHAVLAEGDHVIQDFQNATVNVVAGDQYAKVINELTVVNLSGSTESKTKLDAQISLGAEMSFLAKTRLHLRNEVGEIKMPARPTTMVIDMQNSTDANPRNGGHGASKTVFGRDVEEISHVQFHDPLKDEVPRHVMILGEAGAGKSTISAMYCLAVADGNVGTLRSVELVHYVQAANLHHSTTNAFDLLFTEQMTCDPMTELTENERRAGAKWLNENSDKLLLTIDGLDQCLDNFAVNNLPKTGQQNSSRVSKTIARIMGRNIWRGAYILTTSRWNIYWNFTAEQKPNKVIGLRGLDDENLRLAASGHSVNGDLMIDQLVNTSLQLLNLCRNPMFLKYMTKVFQTNPENLPDCISGLMSAFFRNFFRLSSEKYGDITRLAYHGMLENLFVFSRCYLENLGINPKDLNDFLSAGANPEKDQDIANQFDDIFAFSHQTMQEFCCALHVASLNRSNMKRFISNDLNKNGLELTRQLFYGLILNDKVTNPMRKFLTGRKTPIQDCREMLFEELLNMVTDGTIRDISTVRLLNECGDDTIKEIKQHVQRVTINSGDLLYTDQILLITMIKRLSPLRTTFVEQINLDPSMILYVKDCLKSADIFEAGYEIMDSVKQIHFADVMTILNQSKLWYVRLRCDDDVKLLFLTDWIKRSQIHLDNVGLLGMTQIETLKCLFKFLSIHSLVNLRLNINSGIIGSQFKDVITSRGPITRKVDRMTIEDKSITYEKVEAYLDIFRRCKFTMLCLDKCDLTDKDVDMISQFCRGHGIKLSTLSIWDGRMMSDVYSDVADIISITGCSQVVFGNCDLTKTKLERFAATCKKKQISLSTLSIWDGTMMSDIYCDVANIISITGCSDVVFGDCDLTKQKLERFRATCKKKQISLAQLSLCDGMMTSDIYGNVADIISITGCSTIFFGECDLTKQKLQSFTETGRNNKISLSTMFIIDAKMPAESFREIAITLKTTCCKEIQFEKCELTSRKLHEFYTGCKDNDLSLSNLILLDAKMSAESFREIAITLKTTCCKEIRFVNCELTARKLSEFINGCKANHLSLTTLFITDAELPAESYREIAITLKSTYCQEIHFQNCEMTTWKLCEFFTGCKDHHLSIHKVSIFDSTMPPLAYYYVAAIVIATRCTILYLGRCDLSKHKLESLAMCCKEIDSLIPILAIDWSYSIATDDHISVLCDLMTFAVAELALFNWELDAKGRKRLIDTLHLENSKIQGVKFPDGSIIYKHVSMRN